jgi:hypothetical protein
MPPSNCSFDSSELAAFTLSAAKQSILFFLTQKAPSNLPTFGKVLTLFFVENFDVDFEISNVHFLLSTLLILDQVPIPARAIRG